MKPKKYTIKGAQYDYRWQKAREVYLKENPLCKFCQQSARVSSATVVDHIKPHKGNQELFWNPDNWQPLCKQCHDGLKQREEIHGFSNKVGIDGWPIDSRHPVNKG